ncbi:MAG: TolC family protein [Gammaproteobacteria bacterium]|nr:TolC family protein [Gammaproteobacteria bacterium]
MFHSSKLPASALAGALLFAAAPLSSSAAPPPTGIDGFPGELTESALIERVVAANPGLAALQAAAEAARHRIEPAGSLDDPMLRYAVSPRTIGSGSFSQQAEFSQPIPWPGTLRERAAAARHQAEAAGADARALRLLVIFRARTALADWRYLAEALAINAASRNLLDELIGAAENRYAAGRGPRQDVLQAELERAGLDNEALRLRQERTRLLAGLNALLNRPPGADLPEAAPLTHLPPPPPLETLEHRALAQHPALARLQSQAAAKRSEVNLAQKAFYPNFQVGVGYAGLMDDPDKRPTLGVTINVPLDRGKRRAALAGARAEAKQSEWALADERTQLLANLAGARAAVEEARASAARYEAELVPLAGEYLDTALNDYRSGVGDFRDVIDAEQRKLDNELALARTRAGYARRMAELERWVGNAQGEHR